MADVLRAVSKRNPTEPEQRLRLFLRLLPPTVWLDADSSAGDEQLAMMRKESTGTDDPLYFGKYRQVVELDFEKLPIEVLGENQLNATIIVPLSI